MPDKVVKTPYPLIDADPHFSRVVRYFRSSDYATWATATAAFPAALYLWNMADPLPPNVRLRTTLRLGGLVGFIGGFLFAYQNSSSQVRFWGWTENKREEDMDLAELKQHIAEGKPLHPESSQPQWIQDVAYRNSAWSQLKFQAFPMFNFVNHQHHGTDPAKYGAEKKELA